MATRSEKRIKEKRLDAGETDTDHVSVLWHCPGPAHPRGPSQCALHREGLDVLLGHHETGGLLDQALDRLEPITASDVPGRETGAALRSGPRERTGHMVSY